MKNICLIPARSGSKGLKNKNMLYIDNKPMIFHTIQAAIKSNLFEKKDIVVSTDSKKYKDIIDTLGITVLLRDENLAKDNTPTSEVVVDFLNRYDEDDINLVLLQPTSPLRNSQDIKNAYAIFENNVNTSVVSVVKKSQPLLSEIDEQGSISQLEGVDKGYTRQNKKTFYSPNGAVFIISKKVYLKEKSFFLKDTKPYIMNDKNSIDIDTKLDFIHVLGINYFDNYKRYSQEEGVKVDELTKKVQTNKLKEKIIISDSILTNININDYTNLSIPGITLKTYLSKIDEVINNNTKVVLINLGINDIRIYNNIEDLIKDYNNLISYLNNKNIEVQVNSIMYSLFRNEIDNVKVEQINNELKRLEQKRKIKYININKIFCEDDRLIYDYTNDGLHLNKKGEEKLESYYNNDKEMI